MPPCALKHPSLVFHGDFRCSLRCLRDFSPSALFDYLSSVSLAVFIQARASAVHFVTLPARILLGYNVNFHVSNEVVT